MDNKKIQIPYMRYIYYDQKRSEELGLNHTLSILMNYFGFYLPLWGESKDIGGMNYYWGNYGKILGDMPTVTISECTLRRHINKLISDKLLVRKVVKEKGKKPRAFYRATNLYLNGDLQTTVNFTRVYNEMEILLKNGRIKFNEKEKIERLLSSYSGKKKKNSTTYNLEGFPKTDIFEYLKEEFSLSEKGEGAHLNIGEEINKDWVISNIIEPIKKKGELHGWITYTKGGNLDVNDEVKRLILSKLQTMFQWFKDNNTEVKSMKGRINTFFGKKWI